MEIEYSETNQNDIDLIAPLWQKLNDHHGAISLHFSDRYPHNTFERRKKDLLNKITGGSMRIDLARDAATGKMVGYCVATVTAAGTGELDSIYILESYRRNGIGEKMMKKAMNWMDGLKVKRKVVQVLVGNEEVYAFYTRYGFQPRCTIMEQV